MKTIKINFNNEYFDTNTLMSFITTLITLKTLRYFQILKTLKFNETITI